MDWTGQWTLARVEDGEAHWETTSQALAREPILPVSVTPRQWQIIRFLAAYRREHGWMPTYTEIARAVGLSGAGPVAYQVEQLEAKGLISRVRDRSAAITLNVSL